MKAEHHENPDDDQQHAAAAVQPAGRRGQCLRAGQTPTAQRCRRGEQEDREQQREEPLDVAGAVQVLVAEDELRVRVHREDRRSEGEHRRCRVPAPGQPPGREAAGNDDDQRRQVATADLVEPGVRRSEHDHAQHQRSQHRVRRDERTQRPEPGGEETVGSPAAVILRRDRWQVPRVRSDPIWCRRRRHQVPAVTGVPVRSRNHATVAATAAGWGVAETASGKAARKAPSSAIKGCSHW